MATFESKHSVNHIIMSESKNYTFNSYVRGLSPKDTLYYNHVPIPNDVIDEMKSVGIQRVMCSINDQEPWHAGLSPIGEGEYIIITGKEVLKSNKLSIGDAVAVRLWEDTSKYGMSISSEMEELLKQDEEGSAYFHKLTDGKIRSLLFMVNKIKSSNKRIEKAVIILEHLKANQGKLDYKMLNEAFKQGL